MYTSNRFQHRWRGPVLTLCISILVAAACYGSCSNPEQRKAAAIEALTGGHTRVVWVQDPVQQNDVFATGKNLRLMGLDTRDGQGERPLISGPANFYKPLIAPCGQRVAYSVIEENAVYLIPWDGSEAARLTRGMAMTFWRDPATQRDWLYVGREHDPDHGFSFPRIIRLPLDAPETEQTVWTGTAIQIDNFQLSADGQLAAGLFPWPVSGVAYLDEQRWEQVGRGCWVSLAPDDSYVMWTFDGAHRNLLMADIRSGERWTVDISQASVGGHEVYHPRWSNHPAIFALTGPYLIRTGRNAIRGGGPEVEIHLGRFSADRREVTDWVAVTDNAHANFFPDTWVAGRKTRVATETTAPTQSTPPATKPLLNPEDTALLLRWDHRDATTNTIHMGDFAQPSEVNPIGQARYGAFLDMDARKGIFETAPPSPGLGERLSDSRKFTLSLYLSPAEAGDEPADIVAFVTPSGATLLRLFTATGDLFIEGDPHTMSQSIIRQRIGSLPGTPHLLTWIMHEDRWQLYLDGHVADQGVFAIDWASLAAVDRLHFGGSAADPRNWSGHLEAVRLHTARLDPSRIIKIAEQLQQRVSVRPPPKRHHVRARAIHVSHRPTPEDIVPYRRSLLQHQYEVLDVLTGDLKEPHILVNHWVILDRQSIPTADWQTGHIYTFWIQPVAQRPELEGERLSSTVPDLTLPVYLEIDDP